MTGKAPFATTDLARFVERRVLELKPKKTQREIAITAGFQSPNMLTMIKQGRSKLALDRVAALALALDVDPKYLLRLAMAQPGNETGARVFDEILGTIVSRNEVGWLEVLREASGNTDPVITTRARSAIRGIFGG